MVHSGDPVGGFCISRQHSFHMLDDPLRRFAIPFRWNRPFLPLPCHQLRKRRWKLAWISPDQFVGTNGDGFGAFGIVAQGHYGLDDMFMKDCCTPLALSLIER